MPLLLDRFGDAHVLDACAEKLEEAVLQLERRIEPLDAGKQTQVLKKMTERMIEVLARTESEARELIERTT